MRSARDEVRARCGQVVLLSALCSGTFALVGGGGFLRLPFAVASGGVLAGTWASTLLRPQSLQASTRASRIATTFKRLPKLIPLASLLAVCGLFSSWAKLSPITATCSLTQTKCLIEYHLILLLSGLWSGIYFFIQEYIKSQPDVKFPIVQQSKFITIKFSIKSTVKKAIKITLTSYPFFAFLYYWKGTILRNFITNFFEYNLETDPYDSIFSLLSPMLFIKIFYHKFLFYFVTYFTIQLFDIYLTQNIKFPIEKTDDLTILSIGLKDQNLLLRKLASQDFLYLSRRDELRRKCVFSLSQPGGHPTNWRQLSTICIDLINNYSERINSLTQVVKIEPDLKPLQNPITSPQLRLRITTQNNSLRNLSISTPPNFNNNNQSNKTFKEAVKQEFDIIVTNLCNKPGINFFFGELSEVKLKQLTNDSECISKVCLGLSQLVAVSLTEDLYGIVQDDLSVILSTLLKLKVALDKLNKSGLINKKNWKNDKCVLEALTDIKSAVKRSVYIIRIAFKDYLHNIILDVDTASVLQPFIDYKEC